MSLTLEQRQHVRQISDDFADLMSEKYRKGAEEHGGNLWEESPLDILGFAIEEAIDQVVYLLTLKRQLQDEEVEV